MSRLSVRRAALARSQQPEDVLARLTARRDTARYRHGSRVAELDINEGEERCSNASGPPRRSDAWTRSERRPGSASPLRQRITRSVRRAWPAERRARRMITAARGRRRAAHRDRPGRRCLRAARAWSKWRDCSWPSAVTHRIDRRRDKPGRVPHHPDRWRLQPRRATPIGVGQALARSMRCAPGTGVSHGWADRQ